MKREESPEGSKLLKTIRLLALLALERMKLKEQVSVMSRAGFDRNEIADLLGTTPNSVSVRLNELKKEARGTARRQMKKATKPEENDRALEAS